MTMTDEPTEEKSTEQMDPQPRIWERLLCSALVLIVGSVVFFGSFRLDSGSGYQSVGPGIFPRIIGLGASICGVVLLAGDVRSTTLSRKRAVLGPEVEPLPTRWKSVLAMVVALVVYALLIAPVGFWQSSGLLFVGVARIIGSKRLFRDAVIGFGLALTAYLLFDRVLGVQLPGGYIRIPG